MSEFLESFAHDTVNRIDGIDISTLGLDDLRTRVVGCFVFDCDDLLTNACLQTIISQDVSLFTGTLRSNLDPFNEHTDEECWEALERCHLISILSHATNKDAQVSLDMPISQSGSLSAGERQLVAMARALLRRSNVVIMDEATSQIDIALDDQVGSRFPQDSFLHFLNVVFYRFNEPSVRSSAVQLL